MHRSSAAFAPLLLLLGITSGCRNACEDDCKAIDQFFEACADELADAGYPLWCYDEVEAHPDGTIDREYQRDCDDGRDARNSCLHVSHARADALPATDNDKRLDECDAETDLDRAVEAMDCEAAIEALAAGDRY